MIVGHMGLCSAGICPASGCDYRLSSVRCYKKQYTFTTRFLFSVVSVLRLPVDSVLPIFKQSSSICALPLVLQQPFAPADDPYCLLAPCYINHGPQLVLTRIVSDTNIMHDGHRHRHSSPTRTSSGRGRVLTAYRPLFLCLHAHPQAFEFLLPIDLLVLWQACVQVVLFVLLIDFLLQRPHA